MITDGIREYMDRDWSAARDRKDGYWAQRIARLGPLEGFRVADELRRHALVLDPGWPDAASRRADLLTHVRVAGLLRRAGPASRR